MKKVMVFGTFDILHRGHENYFKQAKEYGDYLVVVVARDVNVKSSKGDWPMYGERRRLRRLMENETVDKTLLGHSYDKLRVVEEERPDVICLGYDQEVDEKELLGELSERGLEVVIKRMRGVDVNKYKSSILKSSIIID